MNFAAEIAQLADFTPPATVAGGLPSASCEMEYRGMAKRLIASCAPSPALERHWLGMLPVVEEKRSAPFVDLLGALTAILADPLIDQHSIVGLTICRSFPSAKFTLISKPPRRFGFKSTDEARRARFNVDDTVVHVTYTAACLRRVAAEIRARATS